ncbi:class I SAM-dependent RNA methyltransferase [uncultured Desulfuromusa sp.]|uniref:THUMP domain-containing class I SAM-dependent RNA methyltransferase n=1 Tax=uncultured Desulfuromusa sp. TaxID=219183 RepID=UPI002AA8607E|nr:class I SAM-dependent RNA methyltransferase [uncultured Desulfuromusa sp.]
MPISTDHYFAVTTPGLEAVCAGELTQLGIQPVKMIRGGVEFAGGLHELYLANLWLRSATRILVRLGEVTARDFPTLFQRLSRLPWGRFIKPGSSCDIRAVSHGSRLNHTGRIAAACEDAMAKSLGERNGSAGFVQKVFVRMNDNRCEVSVDSSGDLLHRRGYRHARVAAPLRETLAAGCLLACGYDGSLPLSDAMTGSGTFAIEAALIALHRAPGKERNFAFMNWPKFRPGLWQQLLVEAQRGEKETLPAPIFAVDNNPKAIKAAQINIESIGLQGLIELSCGQMQQLYPSTPTGLMICNPPYGERLGKNASLKAFYHDLGRLYGTVFAAWDGAVICPESGLIQSTNLSFSPLLRFTNGGIKVSLLKKT